MSNKSKNIVITGASTGIGKACVLYLDKLGFRIFAGVRKKNDGESLLKEASNQITPFYLDVTDKNAIEFAVKKIEKSVGEDGLVGLVNNAGIATSGPSAFIPTDYLMRILEVNVVGQISVLQAFLPMLIKARGRLVNMSSISGRVVYPMMGHYAASKFALEAITDALRLELIPLGIKVSIIEPGPISTPIWDKGFRMREELENFIPSWAKDNYETVTHKILSHARNSQENAPPAIIVARAVSHALTSKRPKVRYPVGRWVWLYTTVFRIMPDVMKDKLFAWWTGLSYSENETANGAN